MSYEGQYRFVARHKPSDVARIQALGPDIGAVCSPRWRSPRPVRGRPALRARLGNVACTAASLFMNAMSAHTPGGTLAAVLPPLLYAAASDTCIAELRQQALGKRAIVRRRTWPSVLLTAVRWCLRLAFAPLTTLAAARTWVLTDPGGHDAIAARPIEFRAPGIHRRNRATQTRGGVGEPTIACEARAHFRQVWIWIAPRSAWPCRHMCAAWRPGRTRSARGFSGRWLVVELLEPVGAKSRL
ncbi:DUF2637 domain-containing protein [Embleya scabrispora]|uniref:DUF2637 domain-containing protein n=1 Tax=Embleya scabrispora TaxID=159449 RepID=UPI00118011A5|nr:DUF2637 domain-containing protein [Embleya scabrispora]